MYDILCNNLQNCDELLTYTLMWSILVVTVFVGCARSLHEQYEWRNKYIEYDIIDNDFTNSKIKL